MYHAFKSAKAVYWISLILAFLIPGLLFMTINGWSLINIKNENIKSLLQYILIAVLLVAAWFASGAYLGWRIRKVTNILIQECDPRRFIQEMDATLKRACFKRPSNITRYLLFKAQAYFEMADVHSTAETLDKIKVFRENRSGVFDKIYYLDMLAILQIENGELEEAEKTVEEMTVFIEKAKLNSKQRKSLWKWPESKKVQIRMKRGDYSGCREWLEQELIDTKQMLYKVSLNYTLGKVYLHFQEIEKAKEAFNFVVEHGNKLARVNKAKEYLQSIDK